MTTMRVPMFPLNSVIFPGTTLPLHVFEERYRALVEHLRTITDPAERIFGTVAIREGYEVAGVAPSAEDEDSAGTAPTSTHGSQSLFRIGCLLQLTDCAPNPDGSFEIIAVARARLRLDALIPGTAYPIGEVFVIEESDDVVSDDITGAARRSFASYRHSVAELTGEDIVSGNVPQDPEYLSWALAAAGLFTMGEQQSLLEALDAKHRLLKLTEIMRREVATIKVIPSLPATRIARTHWSPN